MYSATLVKADVMRAKMQLGKKGAVGVARALQKVNREMLALQKQECAEDDFDSSPGLPDGLHDTLLRFVADVGEKMSKDAFFLQ